MPKNLHCLWKSQVQKLMNMAEILPNIYSLPRTPVGKEIKEGYGHQAEVYDAARDVPYS